MKYNDTLSCRYGICAGSEALEVDESAEFVILFPPRKRMGKVYYSAPMCIFDAEKRRPITVRVK
jgi:hypothetical protein